MKLTIGIKALNEERHIAQSLQSALDAARPFGGEVVLADSGSTDRTVAIAREFPVRILQLANPGEKSCGAGAQLAFQDARGDYFYLLDGDMVLQPGFMEDAIAYLDSHPQCAGVGGRVREVNTEGHGFQIRAAATRNNKVWQPGMVDRLDCGGLYRTAAVRAAGYFADRNLHAFEEFELGARLRRAGWTLARIDRPALDHYGHQTGGYRLLWRRLKSGYAAAPGEVLRSALGRPQLGLVLSGLGHIRHGLAVMLWWVLCLAALFAPLPVWQRLALLALLVGLPLLGLSARRGSLRLGLYSLTSWNVSALGLLQGLVRPRVPPATPLAAKDLSGLS